MVVSSLRVELLKMHCIPGVRELFPVSVYKNISITRKGLLYNEWTFPIFLQFTSWTSGSGKFSFQNKFTFLKFPFKDLLLVKSCKSSTINLGVVGCQHPLLI